MSTEDRLRAALSARAHTAQTSPDAYVGIRDRVRRRRRAVRLQAATGALALSVAGVAVAVELRPTDRALVPTIPTPSASPAPSFTELPASSPSPVPGASETPAETAAAVLFDGSGGGAGRYLLALISARTGETLTVLRELPTSGGIPYGESIAITPDRATVYYVGAGGTDACAPPVIAVDVKTGRESLITTGGHPTLSPDGRHLAVDRGCGADNVFVVDLATGSSRGYDTVPPTASPDDFFEQQGRVTDLEWEGTASLLVARSYEGGVALVRITLDGDLPPAALDHVVVEVERRGAETLAVFECCYPEPDRYELRRLDLASNRHTTLVSRDDGLRDLRVDTRGVALFLTAYRDGHYELWRIDLGGQPRRIAAGQVRGIAW